MSQKDYTLQDIINLFAQSKKEYEERQKEYEERQKEYEERQKEREKEEQELREQMKRTDEFLSKKFSETDARLDKKFAETDSTLKKMGIHLGGISNNNGEMAEEFFYRSLQQKLTIANIHYDDIGQNWKKTRNGIEEEYDIILTNGKVLEVVEVKYKVHPEDIAKLERKYNNFKKLFPVYESFEIKGAIAGMTIPKESMELAKQKGFHVLIAKGDHVEEM